MRPIDADALAIELCQARDSWTEDDDFEKGVRMGITRGINGAKHAPTIGGWIPCSEQLPSEKGEYLVTYHPCYHDIVEPEVRVGIDTFRGKTSWAKKKYQKVIAWKPLPMAYQGE